MIHQPALLDVSAVDDSEMIAALRDVYSRRARQLRSFGRRLGLDEATAEDVMQESFLRAADQRAGSIDNLDAWLFRVVHNLATDHRRRGIAFLRWQLKARLIALDGDDHLRGADDRVWVWTAVDRLPERQRAVIYLRFRADFEFSTIARILGISEGGARANCARGLSSLRKWMTER